MLLFSLQDWHSDEVVVPFPGVKLLALGVNCRSHHHLNDLRVIDNRLRGEPRGSHFLNELLQSGIPHLRKGPVSEIRQQPFLQGELPAPDCGGVVWLSFPPGKTPKSPFRLGTKKKE